MPSKGVSFSVLIVIDGICFPNFFVREELLNVSNLKISFGNGKALTEVVHGISFSVAKGEILAIIGESGSGKSITGLSLTRLLPAESGCLVSGKIEWDAHDILSLKQKDLRRIRGGEIAYVFQDPFTSLHPQIKIGEQILECVKIHQPHIRDTRSYIVELLEKVGISDASNRTMDFSHQLSGGMLQRVIIAMALACRPKLIIADEPTTALDVQTQSTVLKLFKKLRDEFEVSILLISHDLSVVSNLADRVLLMRKGEIVEEGTARELLSQPKSEYGKGLLQCIPKLGSKVDRLRLLKEFLKDEY